MSRDTTVIAFRQPEAIDDPLTEVAREGARRMLAQVLIAEAASFIAMWKDLRLPDGRDRIVRQGQWPASRNPDRGWACRGPSRDGARPGRRAGVDHGQGGEDALGCAAERALKAQARNGPLAGAAEPGRLARGIRREPFRTRRRRRSSPRRPVEPRSSIRSPAAHGPNAC